LFAVGGRLIAVVPLSARRPGITWNVLLDRQATPIVTGISNLKL